MLSGLQNRQKKIIDRDELESEFEDAKAEISQDLENKQKEKEQAIALALKKTILDNCQRPASGPRCAREQRALCVGQCARG